MTDLSLLRPDARLIQLHAEAGDPHARLGAALASLEGADWGLLLAGEAALARQLAALLGPGTLRVDGRLDVSRSALAEAGLAVADLHGDLAGARAVWLLEPDRAAFDRARRAGVRVIVDATLAPGSGWPRQGADYVVYRNGVTLTGHIDAPLAALFGSGQAPAPAAPPPSDLAVALALRDVATLPLRLARFARTAAHLAERLGASVRQAGPTALLLAPDAAADTHSPSGGVLAAARHVPGGLLLTPGLEDTDQVLALLRDQPQNDQPQNDQRQNDQPQTHQPQRDQPEARRQDQQREREVTGGRRGENQPREDQLREDQAREDQSREDQSREDPAERREDRSEPRFSRAERPREDRPREGRPRESRFREDRPQEDRQRGGRRERFRPAPGPDRPVFGSERRSEVARTPELERFTFEAPQPDPGSNVAASNMGGSNSAVSNGAGSNAAVSNGAASTAPTAAVREELPWEPEIVFSEPASRTVLVPHAISSGPDEVTLPVTPLLADTADQHLTGDEAQTPEAAEQQATQEEAAFSVAPKPVEAEPVGAEPVDLEPVTPEPVTPEPLAPDLPSTPPSADAAEGPAADLTEEQAAIYARLREWRNAEAKRQEISRFIVSSNAALAEIARRVPYTLDDLAAVRGMGPARLQKYGDKILEVVRG